MKKEEYMNRVAEIYETLAFAIQDFKVGKIDDEEMQSIIRKAWKDMPQEYMLLNTDLADMLEIDGKLVGEVVETAPYEDEYTKMFKNQMVEDIIAEVPNMKTDGMCRLTIYGSNSFIPNIIGEAEWEYLR